MPAIHCAQTSALSPGRRRDSSSALDGRSFGGLEAGDAASAGALAVRWGSGQRRCTWPVQGLPGSLPTRRLGPREAVREHSVGGSAWPLCGRVSLPLLVEAARTRPRFGERRLELGREMRGRPPSRCGESVGDGGRGPAASGKMQPAAGSVNE